MLQVICMHVPQALERPSSAACPCAPAEEGAAPSEPEYDSGGDSDPFGGAGALRQGRRGRKRGAQEAGIGHGGSEGEEEWEDSDAESEEGGSASAGGSEEGDLLQVGAGWTGGRKSFTIEGTCA